VISSTAKALYLDLAMLVCGLSLVAFSRHERRMEQSAQLAVVASLDSAIVAALPGADGSGAGDSSRVLLLANQKRDLQIASDRFFKPWDLGYGAGIGMTLVAVASLVRSGAVRLTQRGERADTRKGDV
jgi:hypothetical protein